MKRAAQLLAFAILLLGAVAPAASPPLLTPPNGMTRVAHAPFIADRLFRHATLAVAYRGTMHVTWMGHRYSNPSYITVIKTSTMLSAAEAGIDRISLALNPPQFDMASMRAREIAYCRSHFSPRQAFCDRVQVSQMPPGKMIAARPVTLCRGTVGWWDKIQSPSGDETYEEVYGAAGGVLYSAEMSYSKLTGDVFHGERSLLTLCPPQTAAHAAAAQPLPVSAPQHWFAGGSGVENAYPDLTPQASWVKLAPKTASAEGLLVYEASDTSEYVTPEQQLAIITGANGYYLRSAKVVSNRERSVCGDDGWFTELRGRQWGYPYVVQTTAAYANDTMYVVEYIRRAEEVPDSAAVTSQHSFCPAKAATPAPLPAGTP